MGSLAARGPRLDASRPARRDIGLQELEHQVPTAGVEQILHRTRCETPSDAPRPRPLPASVRQVRALPLGAFTSFLQQLATELQGLLGAVQASEDQAFEVLLDRVLERRALGEHGQHQPWGAHPAHPNEPSAELSAGAAARRMRCPVFNGLAFGTVRANGVGWLIAMLNLLRYNRFAAVTAILALCTGLWLFCPCPASAMGTAPANGSAQVSHDPHACCKTKPGLRAAATSCCPDEVVRSASVLISSPDTGSILTPPAATDVVDAPSIDHAVPMAPAIGAVSFRPPLLVVLRI